jgi:hypothetical protein
MGVLAPALFQMAIGLGVSDDWIDGCLQFIYLHYCVDDRSYFKSDASGFRNEF